MSNFHSKLFPTTAREFPGQRWLNIILRTFHLIGIAGISGGYLFGHDQAQWLPYWYLTLGTGIALSMIFIWSTALWLFQLKGLFIIIKLVLLWLAMKRPELQSELFILVITISAIIAHAPGKVRGFVWLSGLRKTNAH